MPYNFSNIFSLFLFANAAFSFGLAFYVGSHRTTNVAKGIIGVLVGAGIWSVADGIRAGASTANEILFWNRLSYLGVAIVPPATVLFVAAYTDDREWLRPRRFGSLVAISALMVPFALTNWQQLWRVGEQVQPEGSPPVLVAEEFGTVHLLWNAYVLAVIVPLLFVLLFRAYRSTQSRLFRRQIAITLLALAGPIVASTLFVLNVTTFDFTPAGFTLFGLAVTVAVTRYDVLDIVPIARDSVVENIDSGMVVLDADNRVIDVNPRAVEIIDTPREVVIGSHVADVVNVDEDIQALLQTTEYRTTQLTRDVDGTTKYYTVKVSPVQNGTRVWGRVVIFDDITQQFARQERLEEQNAELQRKNERLDQFASMVSHDLRNPLNVAMLQLERGRTNGTDEALATAASSLERMERMIDQLLTLARLENRPGETDDVHLRTVAERAWKTVSAPDARLDIDDELAVIRAHPDLLVELLENLFRNAIDHNDGAVTVSLTSLGDGEGFAVSDDGTGVSPEKRDEIFAHGFTTDSESTGFGLSIASDIVDAHGWEIAVTDSEEGGARFEIRT